MKIVKDTADRINELSETVTWYQEVWQKAYDWGAYIGNALGNYTYFVAGGDTSDLRQFPEGYPAVNPNAPGYEEWFYTTPLVSIFSLF